MAHIDRRDFIKFPLAAGLASALPPVPLLGATEGRLAGSSQLANGFRTHVQEADIGYIALKLSLRSNEIMREDAGLSHIMEHTSFVGAAGDLSADQVNEAWKDHVQDSNATTAPGEIMWSAVFLPGHLDRVIELLALTSLDQKFDVETVQSEKEVVMQELLEDKLGNDNETARQFDAFLYGATHPLGRDTLEAEIEKASTSAEDLAEELRLFAEEMRLPGNMNLYMFGDLPRGALLPRLIEMHFGKYPHRSGPLLDMPIVERTSSYKHLTKTAGNLQAPLAELEVAWSTGVTITDAEAPSLILLTEYIKSEIFDKVRGKDGDAYSPEVYLDASDYAGIIDIKITTTKGPARVEKRIFEILSDIKDAIGERELPRLKERVELSRRRNRRDDSEVLDAMIKRTQFGIADADLDVQNVTLDQVRKAAQLYLPDYGGGYVRITRLGKSDSPTPVQAGVSRP